MKNQYLTLTYIFVITLLSCEKKPQTGGRGNSKFEENAKSQTLVENAIDTSNYFPEEDYSADFDTVSLRENSITAASLTSALPPPKIYPRIEISTNSNKNIKYLSADPKQKIITMTSKKDELIKLVYHQYNYNTYAFGIKQGNKFLWLGDTKEGDVTLRDKKFGDPGEGIFKGTRWRLSQNPIKKEGIALESLHSQKHSKRFLTFKDNKVFLTNDINLSNFQTNPKLQIIEDCKDFLDIDHDRSSSGRFILVKYKNLHTSRSIKVYLSYAGVDRNNFPTQGTLSIVLKPGKNYTVPQAITMILKEECVFD